MFEPIPEMWIKQYVDQLLESARIFGDTPMGRATAQRAECIMDMVEAFRKSRESEDD